MTCSCSYVHPFPSLSRTSYDVIALTKFVPFTYVTLHDVLLEFNYFVYPRVSIVSVFLICSASL